MEFMFLPLLLGLIPAAIAQGKGRSFVLWWIYGTLILIIALPHALLASKNQGELDRRAMAKEGMAKCPFCAELIRREARVCRYCSKEIPQVRP